MSDSIDDVFDLINKEVNKLVNNTGRLYLHNTTKLVAESWANEIISLLMHKNVYPPLSAETIKRRKTRGNNIFGPDYPLIESGEWITYIEFNIVQHDTYDELEVGVFDTTSQIGHSNGVTPVYIAKINEYGFDDKGLSIPARNVFANSELRINAKLDAIIKQAWNSLKIEDVISTTAISSLTGRIVYNGSNFIFRWDM